MERPTYTKEEVKEAATAYFSKMQGADAAALPAGVWTDKYALRDRDNAFYELNPDDMHWRLAHELARVEAKYAEGMSAREIHEFLKDFGQIIMQGSPSFGIGNDFQLVSTSNCAVINSPEDRLSSIMEAARDMATLYKRRFGVGLDLGKLRPDGAHVNNAAITSTGAHSFMDFFSYVTRMIGQSGRRGALMLTMPILHPDAPAFITKKDDKSLVTGANVSLRVDDAFMRAVEADEEVTLRFPVDAPSQAEWNADPGYAFNGLYPAKVESTMRAQELFRMIAEQATKNAEPGILFWDTIQRTLPLDFYRTEGFETLSTNPCLAGETRVAVADGRGFVSIKELAEAGVDVPVYAVGSRGETIVRTMRNPRITGVNAPIMEVELENGHTFRATPNHKLLLSNGDYRELQDLIVGDSLHLSTRVLGTMKDFFPNANANSQKYVWVRNQNRKSYELEHRKVYEFHFGPIPAGHVIHHIDFNAQNNAPSNLVAMTKADHDALHAEGMTGENNPYFRMSAEWRERFHASAETKGQDNGNFSGFSNEELKTLGRQLATSLGRRFSTNEWVTMAKEVGAPASFSPFREDALGTFKEFALSCAEEVGVAAFAHEDPRVVRTYHNMMDQGYDARINNGRVEVLKYDELTKEPFWVSHLSREISFSSVENALKYRNRNPEFQALRTGATRDTYAARKVDAEKSQMLVYSELRMRLGRTPKMKEWENACKEVKVSSRLGSRLSSWPNYGEFRQAAENFNHRIVAIRPVGTETVYNGTVDEVHNFYFGGWEECDSTGNTKWVSINSLQCGEIALTGGDSCRLVAIPLHHFVLNPFTVNARFDFTSFRETARVAMRLSDDLVDLELEKLEMIVEIADTEDERALFRQFIEKAAKGRRTGLGTLGLGDALARLGFRYDSAEGCDMAELIYYHLKHSAYAESVELAKERGAFPIWQSEKDHACEFIRNIAAEDKQLYADMQQYGRRNGAILTNAPTGSISILADNCSSGIEPMFMASYDRKRKVDATMVGASKLADLYRDAQGDYWETYKVFHPNVELWIKMAYEGRVECQRKGFLNMPPALFDLGRYPHLTFEDFKNDVQLPDFFVAAGDIKWEDRIAMQATIQQHIDHSISSTLNLPKGTTADTVEEIYMAAWKQGLKGVTVYVDGSRDAQVLSASVDEQAMGVGALEDIASQLGTDCSLKAIERKISSLQNKVCAPARTHRGLETTGTQKKATFLNVDGKARKVYVYVGKNEDGQPVEVFVTDAGGDEDLIPYGSALGKLTSLALKYDIPANEVAESLIGLKGGSVSYSGKVYNSVPDMVGKLLAKATGEYQNVGSVRVPNAETERQDWAKLLDTGDTRQPQVSLPKQALKGYKNCPTCQGDNLRLIDGCPSCSDCGWGKC
jgi:ribonucleotide reductase alpha subunit